MHLAALHGEEYRPGVGIAHDLLDVEADGVAQDDRHVVAGGAFRGAAEHQRIAAGPARIVDGLHRDVFAHDQDVGVVGEARRGAEPGELARIELRVALVPSMPISGMLRAKCAIAVPSRGARL